ncbi:MAG: hypothetical protein A3A24_01950 [Candidatus Buchananbacteria bacterium RIFCSPLOWO2_01_FULL_46_12]|uniref:AMP-dependent synthetase/ligase domain-containing protein n=2 Tax=Candidatus Buchananiibacteriota TaxID=1817903 RepID=A0A1G1YSB7_9BACT|nr:MAG: hypothetical protein A2744_00075 [Candidatus Buchananbacteria bacterium RIFCSPHIGHO2_01_FULL_44_11]OGY55231.1 MAG: hypothetical protein A3A24_01950 [Candidatus Buchananbacteria bacterium RIFCSPLOWO2_01_FULL_46_12]
MQTIPQKFNETAAKFASRPALKFKYQGAYISLSFAELQQRVTVLAKGLKALGVKTKDRLAILSENRSEWIRMDLATLFLGAISIPVHTTLSSKIIKHILADSGSKVLLVSNQQNFDKVAAVLADLPELQTIIYINLDQPEQQLAEKIIISLDDVMALGEKSDEQIIDQSQPDGIASIVYTSGTTAMPKGVMLTHNNFIFNAEAAVTVVPVTEHDTLLSFLPLTHVLERTAGYYASLVCRGACLAFAESIKTLGVNLQEVKPTILVSVPRVFEKIHKDIWDKLKAAGGLKYKIFLWSLKQIPGRWQYRLADFLVFKKIRAKLGGHFRFTIAGGATLNPKLARFFSRVGIKILEGYGLTETAPVVSVNRLNNVRFGTVGSQLPGVEIKIAPDKEILISGPNVMKGYYNNPALTAEVIDAEGWFHSGDLGFMDSEGFLTIVGRKKEMISMSNGKIVWPEQLELELNNDRFISQSIVYGDNRSYLTVLIVPNWQEVSRELEALGIKSREPDQLAQEPKLIELFGQRLEKINEQFADWEKIREFRILAREFSQEKDELTPTLKLRRKTIEQNYQKHFAQMYQAS